MARKPIMTQSIMDRLTGPRVPGPAAEGVSPATQGRPQTSNAVEQHVPQPKSEGQPRGGTQLRVIHGPAPAACAEPETTGLAPFIRKRFKALRLHGMARAWEERMGDSRFAALGFEEKLALLLHWESVERDNRRTKTKITRAGLSQEATLKEVDSRSSRGLGKSLLFSLASCRWVRDSENILITGPTGTGKSYLACALAHQACTKGHTALYKKLHVLLQELEAASARADGGYGKLMKACATTEVLVLDDWGLDVVSRQRALDLVEIFDHRYGRRATIVTSRSPFVQWGEAIAEPALADAILDRLVHNSRRVSLQGPSRRKTQAIPGRCERT